MTAHAFGKCRMIGCAYEAAGKGARRAFSEHLAEAHGVGRPDPNKTYIGCFYSGCTFQAAGHESDVNKQLRDHLVAAHGINPENPEIPAEARRPRGGR